MKEKGFPARWVRTGSWNDTPESPSLPTVCNNEETVFWPKLAFLGGDLGIYFTLKPLMPQDDVL